MHKGKHVNWECLVASQPSVRGIHGDQWEWTYRLDESTKSYWYKVMQTLQRQLVTHIYLILIKPHASSRLAQGTP